MPDFRGKTEKSFLMPDFRGKIQKSFLIERKILKIKGLIGFFILPKWMQYENSK